MCLYAYEFPGFSNSAGNREQLTATVLNEFREDAFKKQIRYRPLCATHEPMQDHRNKLIIPAIPTMTLLRCMRWNVVRAMITVMLEIFQNFHRLLLFQKVNSKVHGVHGGVEIVFDTFVNQLF